jgi:hypothetical protein
LKKIEDILAVCIEDIRAGRSTLEECLTRYSDMRSQLEPLLRLAANIHEPPAYSPSADFKVRTRVQLMDYIHAGHRKEPWNIPFVFSMKHAWRSGWLKTSAIVLAVLLVISASGTGTAYASQDSLPGDSLYPVKTATENFRRVFTFDEAARVELELAFTGTRLEEMNALASRNPDEIHTAVSGYEVGIEMAAEKAEEYGDTRGKSVKIETVALAISEHLSIIDGIGDTVAPAEKEAIGQVAETAIGVQLRVLSRLAEEDPIRAMEINIETMHNRLKRAAGAVDAGMISEAENALGQFEEMYRFGEEISQAAKKAGHDTMITDTLYAQAASEKLEITVRMHGKTHDNEKSSPQDIDGKPSGNHGMNNGGSSGQGPVNDTPAASENNTQGSENPPKEPVGTQEEPGNGSPGEPPGTPQGPGNPPENPGNGSPGKDK